MHLHRFYVPQTIGVPRLFLCNLSGSVLQLEGADGNPQDERICCNPQEVEETMDTVTKKSSVDEEGGFTRKLKSILLSDK